MMGPLEDSWGDADALPSLQRLNLAFNAFYNNLPPAWGANGSFPALRNLNLSSNYLTGNLLLFYDQVCQLNCFQQKHCPFAII